MSRQRTWTGAELHRASALWREGKTILQIAEAMGRGHESIKHQIITRRDLFPRRYQDRAEIRNDGEPIQLKLSVTPFLHRAIAAEAARRGVSQNTLIREALRDRFLRGRA